MGTPQNYIGVPSLMMVSISHGINLQESFLLPGYGDSEIDCRPYHSTSNSFAPLFVWHVSTNVCIAMVGRVWHKLVKDNSTNSFHHLAP